MIIHSILFRIKKHKRKRLINDRFIGSNVSLDATFDEKTLLEGLNIVYNHVDVRGSFLGLGTYINSNSSLSNCYIGKFCSIGSKVTCIAATHPINFVSSYPGFYNCSVEIPFGNAKAVFNEYFRTSNGYECEIGNDVWIGNNTLIKGGVTIGDGAVIGMGSVVTKDVPPYAIVAGVPAQIIRFRFNEEIICNLLKIRWWDWPLEKIKKNKDDFCNIESFLSKYKD